MDKELQEPYPKAVIASRPDLQIVKEMKLEETTMMIELLTAQKDVFAWSYEDMKGLKPKFYQDRIHLSKDANPLQQRWYRMNPNYVAKVKEEIDKLLGVDFIWPVKQPTWLSPIVMVPKKNGNIQVCVDQRKLNATIITDAFLLPLIDGLQDAIVGHEVYSFINSFSRYNSILMHPADQEKMTYVMEWGVFVVLSNDVQIEYCTSDVSKNNHGHFWRVHSRLSAGISR